MRTARRATRRRSGASSSRSCSRTWTRPRPRPRSSPRARRFEALAAERGLKDTDIDLGTVTKTAMVDRAVADAAFALKAGEVSAPIEGRFGIAIVKVDAIEPAQDAAVRGGLGRAQARARDRARAGTKSSSVQDKIEDERLGGATLAEAAQEVRPDAARDRGDRPHRQGCRRARRSPACPQGVDVLSAAFSADVRAENEPLRLPSNGGYVWYDVDSITPSRERTLDEVKDQVEARWRDDEIATRLRAKATEMLDKLKAGTSFAELAAADKLKVEWRPGIKRGSPPPGLSAVRSREMFRTREGRHRQRRRRLARRADRVPRHRDQRAGARSRSGRGQAHRRGAAPARSPRT